MLGSGGARGLAHIGVIECLVENGYDIQCIAGSSMGALVGGIYAAGKLEIYRNWVTALEKSDVVRLLDLSFGRGGFFKGDRIITVLRDLIGDCNIEDLPISYTAVATDIDSEKEAWLHDGPLFDAIRASIAFPTIFTPHRYRGRRFLDGGLVNPMPIAPTLNQPTSMTIAVDLSGQSPLRRRPPLVRSSRSAHADRVTRRQITDFIERLQRKFGARDEEEIGLLEIIARSIDIMQSGAARAKLAAYSPDMVIDIPRDACNFLEFHRARELVEIGRSRAAEVLRMFESS